MGETNDAPPPSMRIPLPPTAILHATDMTEQMRHSAITIAENAFKTPVSQGKVYAKISEVIRIEFGKSFDVKEKEEGSKGGDKKKSGGNSSGWCCVVGDNFGSCVTHRMKTYM
jgi:hypothetical protein